MDKELENPLGLSHEPYFINIKWLKGKKFPKFNLKEKSTKRVFYTADLVLETYVTFDFP